MRVREAIADAVASEDADVLFALMGNANLDLICDLGERHGLRVVHGRHEQGVVGMADGFARFSGRPGYATVTQGPGLTNAATSLTVAQRHGSPVLLLAGDTPLGDGRNSQWFDQAALGQLTASSTSRVTAVRGLEDALAAAFGAVRSGRPHLLNVPGDVQRLELDAGWRYTPRYVPAQRTAAEPRLVAAAAELLASARQPGILAGRGAKAPATALGLVTLAELLSAPMATSLHAKGLFAGHALDAGMSGGWGDGRARRALAACDVLLAVGASLNPWTTDFGAVLDGQKLIQVATAAPGRGHPGRPAAGRRRPLPGHQQIGRSPARPY
jgi:acetolactate synthase I/II/III large subunit